MPTDLTLEAEAYDRWLAAKDKTERILGTGDTDLISACRAEEVEAFVGLVKLITAAKKGDS